jgi:uncharacterized membrane protein
MPRSVKIALSLLVAALVVGLVRMLLEPAPVDPALPAWFGPVVGGLTFLLLALLVGAMATGRRWALVLSVVLFVVGLPASLSLLRDRSLGGLLVSGGQTLAGGIAYVLLCTRASRQWFRAARELRRRQSERPGRRPV